MSKDYFGYIVLFLVPFFLLCSTGGVIYNNLRVSYMSEMRTCTTLRCDTIGSDPSIELVQNSYFVHLPLYEATLDCVSFVERSSNEQICVYDGELLYISDRLRTTQPIYIQHRFLNGLLNSSVYAQLIFVITLFLMIRFLIYLLSNITATIPNTDDISRPRKSNFAVSNLLKYASLSSLLSCFAVLIAFATFQLEGRFIVLNGLIFYSSLSIVIFSPYIFSIIHNKIKSNKALYTTISNILSSIVGFYGCFVTFRTLNAIITEQPENLTFMDVLILFVKNLTRIF